MRVVAPLFLLCTLSGVAVAQTAEQCPPTPRAGDFLACYNGTTPARTVSKPKTSKASITPDKPTESEAPIAADKPGTSKIPNDQRAKYVDMLAAENKKMDAKLKMLCRGC